MAYIITRLCRDCVDTACVAVCPVDCIPLGKLETQEELMARYKQLQQKKQAN